MIPLRQIASVTLLNLKNLPSRLGPSLVIVAGTAAAIGVLISILSLAAGYAELQRRTGDPGRAIILSQSADNEGSGAISRGALGDIMAMPGITRDKDGASLADPEYLSILLANRRATGSPPGLAILRGFGRKALAVRPELKIVAGRMFRSGARERLWEAA